MQTLIFASRNAHKVDEVARILAGGPLEILPLPDLPGLDDLPEDHDSFRDNALQKARTVAEITGRPALADDSGLEVLALGGAPGVHSKRYSPEATAEANNRLLLARLAGITDRRARFVCALALVGPEGEAVVIGSCEGRIGLVPRGAGGFGYDPLFLPDEAPGRSMAELLPHEKDAISHRGRALQRLPELFAAYPSDFFFFSPNT